MGPETYRIFSKEIFIFFRHSVTLRNLRDVDSGIATCWRGTFFCTLPAPLPAI